LITSHARNIFYQNVPGIHRLFCAAAKRAASSFPPFRLVVGIQSEHAIGKIAAEWILRKVDHRIFHTYALSRFKHGETRKENFVIG
jgi:hypothetical protein